VQAKEENASVTDLARSPALDYDVIIIGGGPAGLMAAIAAREEGAKTLLVDKGERLGRKLAISGGGRCNVTNNKPLPELMANIPGNPKFLYSALTKFGSPDITQFFERLGIRLKEEDHGRVFPVSDKASTVVNVMVERVYALGCEVWLNRPVVGLMASETGMAVKFEADMVRWTRAVVIAAGGSSVPQTGSTGDAYPWAKALGHRIVAPYPTAVPLTSQSWFITQSSLKGISLRETTLSLWSEGSKRPLAQEQGDVLFSHFGLTGPAALRLSHFVSTALRADPAAKLRASIDTVPGLTADEMLLRLSERRRVDGKKRLETILESWVPARMATVLLIESGLDGHQVSGAVSGKALQSLVQHAKGLSLSITGTLPLEKATVTGGGVSVQDIAPATMASKRCPGLYFCGEVIDVHAHTGGYNITVAFSTGHLAGQSAAHYALALPAPHLIDSQ